MEWIDSLRGLTVGLDTGPLIYYIEEHQTFLDKIGPFFAAAERNEFRIVTSVITLTEVLVRPVRESRPELAEQYRDILLRSSALRIVPLDESIAEEAARLRARYSLKTRDAIQVATCIRSRASAFLTSDAGLRRLTEIHVLVLNELT